MGENRKAPPYMSLEQYEYIKDTVQKMRNTYKTRNPFDIFDKKGIDYSQMALTGEEFSGFVHGRSDAEGNPSFHVYINKYYDRRSRFIIGVHELAHIALHHDLDLNMMVHNECSFKEEYEADVFIMEFLPEYQPLDGDHMDMAPEELRRYIHGLLKKYKDTGLIVDLRRD